MQVATPEAPRDALSRLRIQREERPVRRSFFARILRFVVVLCLVAALTAGGVIVGQSRGWIPETSSLFQMPESFRPKPEVQSGVVSVEQGRSADATVVATGYLESRRQARIGARATGRIEQVNVEEGSKVTANDVLAVLEHADLDAALAAAKATLARSKSELLEQDVEIQRTQREFERAEKSVAAKTITSADFDTSRFTHDAAVARRVSVEATIQLSEARVREAEQLLENMFVRAPFDGTVISKDAEKGESIMPGGMGEASGRGSVVTIADLDHLEVDCDVKEDFISRVLEEQIAEVSVDAVPDRRYKGRVRKIIPMGDRARATVKVKVEILDADQRLFPDMSSTVYFLPNETESSTKQDERRVFCPAGAVLESETETYVLVITAEGRTKKTVVVIGETKDERTVITSGLSGGEKVVVKPGPEIRDGMLVKTAQ